MDDSHPCVHAYCNPCWVTALAANDQEEEAHGVQQVARQSSRKRKAKQQ
jgi:hypothetical protein